MSHHYILLFGEVRHLRQSYPASCSMEAMLSIIVLRMARTPEMLSEPKRFSSVLIGSQQA